MLPTAEFHPDHAQVLTRYVNSPGASRRYSESGMVKWKLRHMYSRFASRLLLRWLSKRHRLGSQVSHVLPSSSDACSVLTGPAHGASWLRKGGLAA